MTGLAFGTVLALGCGGHSDADNRTSAAHTPGGDSAARTRRAPVSYEAERRYDLAGNGVRNRIVVSATGPTWDSLTVRLEIQGEDGFPLYTDQWSSMRYFKYVPRAGKSDSAVKQIVLGHLQRLLADSAFTPASATTVRARIDTPTVEYDLKEMTVRAMHRLSDTVPLPPALHTEVQRFRLPTGRLDSALTAIHNKPRFTYFAGGEVTYTLAWDPKLGRFVKMFSCC